MTDRDETKPTEEAATRETEAAPRGHGASQTPVIAGYRIVRRLGEGGMGVVFEAEQQQPRRPVALKVVRGGPYLDETRVRLFSREAQALGRLSHPGIAAIYEFGRTDDGHPFFAMELVRGETLAAYLADRPSPLESRAELELRLRLFRKICDAVNYAHQRAVIHRDLKPGNVLVRRTSTRAHTDPAHGDVPDVKVLDFGMARITEGDVANVSAVTELGRIQGTLAYMSPEQARGNPDEIDLRSDVYALGVVLYEMLIGEMPYSVRGLTISGAVRVICEQDPEAAGLARLDRDLQTILTTALEKDADRRYQSVASVAGDVERFLNHEPLVARPPSTAYQLRLLVRRHKFWFGFAATVAVLLVALALTMTVQANRIARERDAARLATERADQLNDFLFSLFEAAAPNAPEGDSDKITARQLLDIGASELDGTAELDPIVQAQMLRTVGSLYGELGFYEQAEPLLRRAAVMLGTTEGASPREVAVAKHSLGWVLIDKGDPAGGEKLLRQALATFESDPEATHEQLHALIDLGAALEEQGKYDDADQAWNRALAFAEDHGIDTGVALAALYHNMGVIAEEYGELDEAAALLEKALAIKQRELGDDDTSVAKTLTALGATLKDSGRCSDAEPIQSRALAIYEKRLDPTHEMIAVALNNLAECSKQRGKLDQAEELYARALQIFESGEGDNAVNISIALFNLADVQLRRGRPADAEPLLRRSYELTRELYGADHIDAAETLAYLGSALGEMERHDEARRRFLEAIDAAENGERQGGEQHATILDRYADWLVQTNRNQDAREARARAESIRAELEQ